MKFYKRDPDRALAGMAELSLKQRGAYNSLLDLLYSRDGDVPDDDARVARMISCHWREWATAKRGLIAAGKIWVEGGKMRARRVQETIKEASDFSQEQSKRASKGWQKRKTLNKNNDPVMPPGNASTATATATATPTQKERLPPAAIAAPPPCDMPPIPEALDRRKAKPNGEDPKPAPRGTRLDPDWQPGPRGDAAATERGFSELETAMHAERFKNHFCHGPGRSKTWTDWHRAWINWLARETPGSQRGGGRHDASGDRHRDGGVVAAVNRLIDQGKTV